MGRKWEVPKGTWTQISSSLDYILGHGQILKFDFWICKLAIDRVQDKSVMTGLAHVKEEMLQQLSIRVRTSQHHHSVRCLNTPDTCSHVLCVEDMVLVTSRVTGLSCPGPDVAHKH